MSIVDTYVDENGRRVIVLELKPDTVVVSFKARADLVGEFDRLRLLYLPEIGRSALLRSLVRSMAEALKQLPDTGIVEKISLCIGYVDVEKRKQVCAEVVVR